MDGTDYVVGRATDTAAEAGDVLSVQLELDVAGRFIRSVYPGYGFRDKATFTPADGGPVVTADQFEPRF